MLDAELAEAAARWFGEGLPAIDMALCTGTGLSLEIGEVLYGPVPLSEWLPFEVDSLPGHPHEVVLVDVGGADGPVRVLHYRGRVHAYQGYGPAEVVFAARLAHRLGAGTMVHGNAAGGMDPALPVGRVVLIEDHLNLTGMSPLIGRLPRGWPTPFVDMTNAYCPKLRRAAFEAAERAEFDLAEGIYAGLLGPSFEMPAEIASFRTQGATLVGMSTVLEVIACRHLGVRCLGFSLITNLAAGLVPEIGHEEIFAVGRDSWPGIGRWLGELLPQPELLS